MLLARWRQGGNVTCALRSRAVGANHHAQGPRVLRRAPFVPIGGRDLVASVARRIEDAITAGLLPPGSRLPSEEHLATLFGISPATLRAALHELRTLGTITTFRGRLGGSVVTVEPSWVRERAQLRLQQLGPTEVRERGDLHSAILAEGARLAAARATPSERESLAAMCDALGRASDPDELRAHLEIVTLSQSARLANAELEAILWLGGLLVVRTDGARAAMRASLARLARCVVEPAPAAAAEAARTHVAGISRWLNEQLIETHAHQRRV